MPIIWKQTAENYKGTNKYQWCQWQTGTIVLGFICFKGGGEFVAGLQRQGFVIGELHRVLIKIAHFQICQNAFTVANDAAA